MYKFSQLWWMVGMQTKKSATKSEKITKNSSASTWIENEVGGCNFKDVRLAKRFGKLLGMMSEGIGESVPYACQDWANTKAAYRFFSNDTVSEEQILAGHFQATKDRLSQANPKGVKKGSVNEIEENRED
jgi:hypothetical protein